MSGDVIYIVSFKSLRQMGNCNTERILSEFTQKRQDMNIKLSVLVLSVSLVTGDNYMTQLKEGLF